MNMQSTTYVYIFTLICTFVCLNEMLSSQTRKTTELVC